MTRLPASANVATDAGGAKLHAPSAERNIEAITALISDVCPPKGRALEIASGTGQHVVAFARVLTRIDWHPTEIAADRIASIDAYAAEAGLPNLKPAQLLNAATQGWAKSHPAYDLIHMANLLHLITEQSARAALTEAVDAMAAGGIFVIYGAFMRAGQLTSEGDATFDAQLRDADPLIGYKDDQWVLDVLKNTGDVETSVQQMPANNLAFIARKATL